MIKNRIQLSIGLIFLISIVLLGSRLGAEQSGHRPEIHFDQTTHTFPTVFEGEQLSHSFELTNKGSADLEIWDVTNT